MLTVHERGATVFTTTGLGVLDPHVVEVRVREELGGQYSLSLVYPADGPLAKHLTIEAIIAAPVPGLSTRQGFRIHEISTTLDGLLEITAFHVFYDLAANFIADTYVVNKTAKAALDQLLAAATTPHRVTATSSDSTTRASARVVRMPLAGALMDSEIENSFVSRWGGEISRDNWHIHHSVRRGQDRGVVIRDRKNLTGYQSTIDLSSVVTRIVPIGYDGITLPELYVDSPKLASFVTPRIRVMRYPHIKAIKNAERPADDEVPLAQAHKLLRQAAKNEYAIGRVDEPHAWYKVSFVDLASTSEYADFAQLETVILGDTVTVRHGDLGVSLSARVVGYEYDPLRQAYLSVELGSAAAKFTTITRSINSAVSVAETARDMAGIALASADGKTTNHYGDTQPTAARMGDTWFKPNGETTEIWVYQETDTGQPGWVAVATDLNHALVSAELDRARQDIEHARKAVSSVKTEVAGVREDITNTNQTVTNVKTDVEAARQAGARAQAKADTARAQASQAITHAQQAADSAKLVGEDLAAYKLTVADTQAGVAWT